MIRALVLIILFAIALWVFFGTARAQSIGGVECFTIRKLTKLEQWYWIKRLGLSQDQVNQIRKVCKIK